MDGIKSVKQAPKRHRKVASLDRKKARAGWIFVLPFVIGFIVIYLPIIWNSISYSFSTVVPGKTGITLQFAGLANYKEALFVDTEFVQTLTSGIQQLIFDIPAIVVFSLFMAVLLNQKMLGRAAFRAIFFIPVILATGLIDEINNTGNTLMEYLNNSEAIETGDENAKTANDFISMADLSLLFNTMKVGTGLVEYITEAVNNIYDIINRSGVQLLVFLAGLQSISPAIYESCSIDGATSWETFWKITFPMISPMILVNTIYTVIDSFTSSSNSVIELVKTKSTSSIGVGSAMAWMYFLVVIIVIAIAAAILSAYIFYQRRD